MAIHSCCTDERLLQLTIEDTKTNEGVPVSRLLGTKLIQSIELTRPVSNDPIHHKSGSKGQDAVHLASVSRYERYEPRFFVGRSL